MKSQVQLKSSKRKSQISKSGLNTYQSWILMQLSSAINHIDSSKIYTTFIQLAGN
jgi:hypothetical protein